MKKLFSILAAALAIAAVSCTKTDTTPETPDDIIFDIKVSPIDTGTKALKSGWTAGDKLNIWFDYNGNADEPNLILRYDGTEWKTYSSLEGIKDSLKTEGNITLVYEGWNDLSKYSYQLYNNNDWFHYPKVYYSVLQGSYRGDYCATPLGAYSESKAYTFDGTVVRATIDSWNISTGFRVLIKNDDGKMTGDPMDYHLQTFISDKSSYAVTSSAIVIIYNKTAMSTFINSGAGNKFGISLGTPDEDGVAFHYRSFSAENQDVTFRLYDGNEIKTYTVKGKTIDQDCNIFSVTLKHSAFVAE